MAPAAPVETTPAPEKPFELYNGVPPAKTVAVRLLRHYVPEGEYEVVGWHRPEKKRKNAAGAEIVVEPAAFITELDENKDSPHFGKIKPAPPVMAGTGTPGKILASTVIKVAKAEARRMRDLLIGTIEIDDD